MALCDRLRSIATALLIMLAGGIGLAPPLAASGGLVRVHPSGSVTPGYRALWAVIVGIDHYDDQSVSTLHFAVNDATIIRKLLIEEFSFHEDHIRFLTEGNASRANIQDAFEHWLPSRGLDANDAILVFFAGHGFIAPDGVEGYLASSELRADRAMETSVQVRWIKDQLALSKVPATHKLIILDSCYSGALFQRAGGNTKNDYNTIAQQATTGAVAATAGDNLAWYFLQPAFMGISAGRYTPVSDGTAAVGHSVFTSALAAVMRDRADSRRPDHAFTFRELAVQVETRVRSALGSHQVPDWGAIEGAGDFVFVPDPRRRRMTPTEEHIEAEKIGRAVAINGPGGTLQAYRMALAALEPLAGREEQWSLRQGGLLELSASRSSLPRLVLPPAKASFVLFSPDGKLGFVASRTEASLVSLPEGTAAPLAGYTGKVARAAFSHDGHLLAVGDSQRTVRLWRLGVPGNGRQLDELKHEILHLAFAPDGRHLAVSDADCVKVFDSLGSTPSVEWSSDDVDGSGEPIKYLAFIDNQRLLIIRGDEVRIWRFATNEVTRLKTDVEGVSAATLSADRSTLVLAADQRVWLMPIDAGKRQPAELRIELAEHPDKVLGFDVFGSRLLTTCEDWKLRIFDIGGQDVRREPKRELPLVGSRVMFARFVAGGAQVVTGGDDLLGVWDVESGRRLATLEGLDVAPTPDRTDATPDGQVLALDRDGNARLWDPPLCKRPFMRLAGHNGPVLAIAYSADGTFLATAGQDKMALVWDANSGQLLPNPAYHGGAVLAVAFAPVTQLLLTGSEDSFASLWEVGISRSPNHIARLGRVTTAAWLPSGKTVAIATSTGAIHWWTPGAPDEFRRFPADDRPLAGLAALSPDGHWAVAASSDGVHIINLQSGKAVDLDHRQPLPTMVAIGGQSPSTAIVREGTIELYDNALRRQPIESDPTDPPSLIALAQDASALLVVRRSEGLLYDLTKEPLDPPQSLAVERGASAIQTAVFAPDGHTVATGNRIGSVQLWDVRTGALVQTLPGHQGRPVRALAFSPDGSRLTSGGDDRVVHSADIRPLAVVRALCEGLENSSRARADLDDDQARRFCARLRK